jgi:hypothetical protein
LLDATERKTLAWSFFLAGVLCYIPGEPLRGPRLLDVLRQLGVRFVEHHATQIAWGLCILIVAYHLHCVGKEERASRQPAA